MSNPSAIHFEMQAPHGTRIYPTMTGCRIEYTAASRQAVEAWLQSEVIRFGQSNLAPEDTVPCPKCGGELKMAGNVPLFCSLCHGALRVSKTTAVSYVASLNQPQMVVREQQFDNFVDGATTTLPPLGPYEQLRQVLHNQQHPTAIPTSQPAVRVTSPESVYSVAQLIDDPRFPTPAHLPIATKIAHPPMPVDSYLAPPDLLPGMSKSSTVVVEEDE